MPLPNSGYMKTGWLTVGRQRPVLYESGRFQMHRSEKNQRKNYYFEANGKMVRNKEHISLMENAIISVKTVW